MGECTVFGFIAGFIMFFYLLKDTLMVKIEKDLLARQRAIEAEEL